MNNRKLFPSLLTLPVLVALIVGCNGMSTTMPTVTTSAAPSKFMYIALLTPDGIGALRIHGDGSLNPLTNAPFPAPPGPDRIVASEQFIFIAGFGTVDALGFCCQNRTNATYKQDQVTGSLTQVASMRHDSLDALSGFALDPAGRFLYAGNENGSGGLDVFAVAQDGHLAQAGGFDPRLGGLFGPVFHPNGQFLYVAGGSGIYRFEINPE